MKKKTQMPKLEDLERRFVEIRALDGAAEEMIVEGYAIVYDTPRTISYQDRSYTEVIVKGALDTADLSDVVMRYNHNDTYLIMARTRNKSLELIKDDIGLKIKATLIDTNSNRDVYRSIKEGLIDKMSFAFCVANAGSEYQETEDGIFRKITKIERLCDVSVVDTPFYDSTSIYARSFDLLDCELKGLDCYREREILKLKINLKGRI